MPRPVVQELAVVRVPVPWLEVQPRGREEGRPGAAWARPFRRLRRRRTGHRRHQAGDPRPLHRYEHHRPGAGRPSLRMMILAATSAQQRLGIAFAVLLTFGWLVYIAAHLRRRRIDEPPGSEIELAPNRKMYVDDEALEGPKLERSLGLALIMLVGVAIALPLYWAHEPARAKGAKNGEIKRSAHR